MMELFHIIEDAFVIVRRRGVFRQAKVFARGDSIYAGYGSGFVMLLASGASSVPDLLWKDITECSAIRIDSRGAPHWSTL
jgi:hypothetical protein